MTADEAYKLARRKSRYGHRDWIVWKERNGEWSAQVYSAASIKAAMLAIGTKGHFTVLAASTAVGHRYGWSMACLARRNACYLTGAA